jgi:hypothetical protein
MKEMRIIFIMIMIFFDVIFCVKTYNNLEVYAESSNFTKFTLKDIQEAYQFIMEIQNASTSHPQVTQFQISGDNKQICNSGNCTYEFGTINISLPTIEDISLNTDMYFELHDEKSERWRLTLLASLTAIKETDKNNLIYEFYRCDNYFRLYPTENPIDKSLDEDGWIGWYLENTWYYGTKKVEYRSAEDTLLITAMFHGDKPRTYCD